jgi:hypothetical protein
MINLLVRVEFIAGQRSLYQNALPENALLAGMRTSYEVAILSAASGGN